MDSMIKWSDTWYRKLAQNDIKFGEQEFHVLCRLCNLDLKIDQQIIHAWKQHSGKSKHVQVSKLVFLNTVRHFKTSASSSSTILSTEKNCPFL